jgi:L-lactate dehydrogenase complex protein LldG
MNDRTAILDRLKSHHYLPDQLPEIDYSVIEEKHWNKSQRIELLVEKMTSVRTEVWRSSKADWVGQLEQIVQAKQINNLLLSGETWCGKAIYAAANIPQLIAYDQPVENWKQRLFEEVDASFTTTMGGIAETGTLVLWPDKKEPRLMSLVPPVHVALLESENVEDTFSSFINKHAWVDQGMPGNALLISGPSKTADIEQTLAYGVHGPKELVVIII